MPEFRIPRAPSLQTFARVMLSTGLLGFLFALSWTIDGFAWWKLAVVFCTGSLAVLQVQRARALELRHARPRSAPWSGSACELGP